MLLNYINKVWTSFFLIMVLTQATQAQGIVTTSGGNLVANGTVKLVMNNSGFTNNGTFTAGNSSLVFTGNQATSGSFIAGSSSTGLYNLVLNKTANGMQLNRDISISNSLLFTSGDSLFLNNQIIDLGSTGFLSGESQASRLTGRNGGYIQATANLNAPVSVNPGNLGFTITSAANPGLTTIRRGHQQQSGASALRYYDITPANNSGLNAEIVINYFHPELLSIPEGNLGIFYSSNGGTIWTNLGLTSLNTISDYITRDAVNTFSRFTLANVSEPLSVKLLQFKGIYYGGATRLDWITGAEIQSDHFEIERSSDGLHFERIGTILAAGSSFQELSYHFIDSSPYPGLNYYRLRQVDLDGSATYSPLIRIMANPPSGANMQIFPNPVKGPLVTIQIETDQPGVHTIKLYNEIGKLLKSSTITLARGSQSLFFELGSLLPGYYTIQVSGNFNKSMPLLVK
ncbi:MAG: T9SS type A sorting domain-containing protein [Chitinophagaceae bacterium]|nr:T9SS type A sorting domain-containing protein [Chitinophagaceae bacterium]